MTTTTGRRTSHTFSAGVASAPSDGTSLTSLERAAESALHKAVVTGNSIVTNEERSITQSNGVYDVVLVDDDDSVADVLEHAASLRHFSYRRFSDGAEAARVLGDGHVRGRVVLLDICLPSLDGFGVLRYLRGHGVLETSRVIMITVRSSEAEMLRAIGLGATEHIAKPFSIAVLMERIGQSSASSAA